MKKKIKIDPKKPEMLEQAMKCILESRELAAAAFMLRHPEKEPRKYYDTDIPVDVEYLELIGRDRNGDIIFNITEEV